jgi:hypothetical protein
MTTDASVAPMVGEHRLEKQIKQSLNRVTINQSLIFLT